MSKAYYDYAGQGVQLTEILETPETLNVDVTVPVPYLAQATPDLAVEEYYAPYTWSVRASDGHVGVWNILHCQVRKRPLPDCSALSRFFLQVRKRSHPDGSALSRLFLQVRKRPHPDGSALSRLFRRVRR